MSTAAAPQSGSLDSQVENRSGRATPARCGEGGRADRTCAATGKLGPIAPGSDLIAFVTSLAIADARRDHLVATGQIMRGHDAACSDLRSVFDRPAERKVD